MLNCFPSAVPSPEIFQNFKMVAQRLPKGAKKVLKRLPEPPTSTLNHQRCRATVVVYSYACESNVEWLLSYQNSAQIFS